VSVGANGHSPLQYQIVPHKRENCCISENRINGRQDAYPTLVYGDVY